jgi:hypothetical protein
MLLPNNVLKNIVPSDHVLRVGSAGENIEAGR